MKRKEVKWDPIWGMGPHNRAIPHVYCCHICRLQWHAQNTQSHHFRQYHRERERGRPSFSLLISLTSPPPRRHATWRPLDEEGLGPPRRLIARTWCCVPIINAPLSAWLFLILIYHFFYSKDHGHWLWCRVPLPPSMPFFIFFFFLSFSKIKENAKPSHYFTNYWVVIGNKKTC